MYENNPNKFYSDQEIISVATKTLNYLVANWGIDCRIEYSATRRSSCCLKEREHTIVIGLPCQRIFMKRGDIHEKHIDFHPRGLNAVVNTVIHEYAHLIVYDLGLREAGIVHGYDFWQYYSKLVKDVLKEF